MIHNNKPCKSAKLYSGSSLKPNTAIVSFTMSSKWKQFIPVYNSWFLSLQARPALTFQFWGNWIMDFGIRVKVCDFPKHASGKPSCLSPTLLHLAIHHSIRKIQKPNATGIRPLLTILGINFKILTLYFSIPTNNLKPKDMYYAEM